jgi:hypothetical protein
MSFTEYWARAQAGSSETAETGSRKSHNSFGGGGTPSGIWSNLRGTVPSLAFEYSGSEEEEWKMEGVY